jgi:hypothetical protein
MDATGEVPEAAPSPDVEAGTDFSMSEDAVEESSNDTAAGETEPADDGAMDETADGAAATGDGATDAVPPAPHVFPATCLDGVKDGDETDIDCGGSCPGCGPHGFCASNADCSGNAPGCSIPNGGCFCQSLSNECVSSHCEDFRLDGDETGVDCGGVLCLRCAIGTACIGDRDCASQACDAISHVCLADPCADHRQDGMESDVDCGGDNCPRCKLGQMCNINIDCQPGLACSAAHTCIQ